MSNNCTNSSGMDVFNNPSNDYVNPGLAPCAGQSDSNNFEFLNKKKAGIISGSNIVASMSLSDISIPVTEWISKTQVIQSGEIIYVPGLTKGLLNKTSGVYLPDFGYSSQEYFFSVDLSVNFYSNFRLNTKAISGTANFEQNLDIDDALNIEFSNEGVNISSLYDPSTIKFIGNNPGFDFDISNVVLNIIDASMDENSPFPPIIIDGENIPQFYNLEISPDLDMPAMKYPNGAMLGYMMTANYPSGCTEADHWLYANNVNSPFDVYYEQNQPTGVNDLSINKIITFDPPTNFGDVSINFDTFDDVSINTLGALPTPDIDSSIIYPPESRLLNALSLNNCIVYEPIIINSVLTLSTLINDTSYTTDPSLLADIVAIYSGCAMKDTSIISTPPDLSINVYTNIDTTKLEDSKIEGNYLDIFNPSTYSDASIYDPSISYLDPSNMILTKDLYVTSIYMSELNRVNVISSFIYDDVSILGKLDASTGELDLADNNDIFNSVIFDGNITGMQIIESYISNSNISKNALLNSYTDSTNINTTDLYSSKTFESSITFSNIFDSSIISSNATESLINGGDIISSNITNSSLLNTNVLDSSIQAMYVNYIELAEDLWVPDVSSETTIISNSIIFDTSLSNTRLVDCSIYDSNILDSSLFGCNVFNSIFEGENNYSDSSTRNVWINGDYDCSVSWNYDSSLLYEKYSKFVDVGMNGTGDDKVMSAGEYLDYINTHDLWEKFGPLSSKFSTMDPDNSTIKNLIGGFYVFNPHEFPVQLEYMLIN